MSDVDQAKRAVEKATSDVADAQTSLETSIGGIFLSVKYINLI